MALVRFIKDGGADSDDGRKDLAIRCGRPPGQGSPPIVRGSGQPKEAGRQPKKRRTGRPRIEDKEKTIEAQKPWVKIGMSRRTWYRRKAKAGVTDE